MVQNRKLSLLRDEFTSNHQEHIALGTIFKKDLKKWESDRCLFDYYQDICKKHRSNSTSTLQAGSGSERVRFRTGSGTNQTW